MYTKKQLESGEGRYTTRQTVVWMFGEYEGSNCPQFETTERGADLAGGELVGYADPTGPVEWI